MQNCTDYTLYIFKHTWNGVLQDWLSVSASQIAAEALALMCQPITETCTGNITVFRCDSLNVTSLYEWLGLHKCNSRKTLSFKYNNGLETAPWIIWHCKWSPMPLFSQHTKVSTALSSLINRIGLSNNDTVV